MGSQGRPFDKDFRARKGLAASTSQDGNRKCCCAFYSAGETEVGSNCVMRDELTTILDAMRAAQAELAVYLASCDRNAELTIAKLVGILDRRDVVRALRAL